MRHPNKSPLFRLAVTTAPEAEDAVAEALARASGQSAVVSHDRASRLSTAFVYLEDERFWTPSRRRELVKALNDIAACGLSIAPARVSWRSVKVQDWEHSWKRHFRPVLIRRCLLLRPGWSRRRPKGRQVELVLDPGLSFGTGQHATTAFCLDEIVRLRPRGQACSLLDVGTGSGILALAGARLGYSPVVGFDFDPEAVAIARQNAIRNQVGHRVRLTRRSVASLSLSPALRFDVVCANLTADLLLRQARHLVAQLKPGGHLLLAGILEEEFDGVRKAFGPLNLLRSQRRGEWRSGSLQLPILDRDNPR